MPHLQRRRHLHENDEDCPRKRSRFVDLEAEVEDEEEDDEEEDEGEGDLDKVSFIDSAEIKDQDEGRHHAHLHTRRQLEEDEISPEDLARQLTKRYHTHLPSRFTGDMNRIPQMLLMPSVNDPGLWRIRVKVSFFRLSGFCTNTP